MAGISNLGDFLAGLEDEKAEIGKAYAAETKSAGKAVLETAVSITPVLTGVHRGSWVVGIGSEPGGSGNEPDPSGAQTLAQGLAVIEGAQAGQDIIILNDGPAIEELDLGRSNQAPAGISDAAIAAGERG